MGPYLLPTILTYYHTINNPSWVKRRVNGKRRERETERSSNLSESGWSEQLQEEVPLPRRECVTTGEATCSPIIVNGRLQELQKET